MFTLTPATLELHYAWLRQERLREAEADRLAALAQQYTDSRRARARDQCEGPTRA